MNLILKLIIIVLGLNFLFSCSKTEKMDCPEDLACTEIFVSVIVKVQNSKNENVKLSKTTVEIEGKNKIVIRTNFDLSIDGYTILDDLSKNDLIRMGSIVIFKGYDINDQLIFNEKYTIGHDCCHIIKISGKDLIITN